MKKQYVIFILLLFMLFNTINIYAENDQQGILFITSGCIACNDAINHLDKIDFKYKIYNISNKDNFNKLYHYNEKYNVPENKAGIVPILFTNEQFYTINDILKIKNNDFPIIKDKKIQTTNRKINLEKIPILAVIVAGFLDGFNPCAFSMLLFFISFVYSNKEKPSDIIKVGMPFVIATFLAYFLIGIGLLHIGISIQNANNVMRIIYTITLIMALFIFILNIRDYHAIKKGKMEEIKNQLPNKLKHTIQNIIRKFSKSKWVIVSSFLLGFIVSILEFFCTGQVYLPTITYVLSLDKTNTYGILLLILYNLSFILPLLIAVILIYKGMQVVELSTRFVDKLKYIKLFTGLFFLFISIFMFKQLILL